MTFNSITIEFVCSCAWQQLKSQLQPSTKHNRISSNITYNLKQECDVVKRTTRNPQNTDKLNLSTYAEWYNVQNTCQRNRTINETITRNVRQSEAFQVTLRLCFKRLHYPSLVISMSNYICIYLIPRHKFSEHWQVNRSELSEVNERKFGWTGTDLISVITAWTCSHCL